MSEYSGLQSEVLARVLNLMKGSDLSASDLVDDARHESSPLHVMFEWDDSVAAEAYRIDQAEGVIRRVKVHVVITPETVPVRVRAFASKVDVGEKSPPGGYRSVESLPVESREALMASMRRDIERLRYRYRHVEELFRQLWDE